MAASAQKSRLLLLDMLLTTLLVLGGVYNFAWWSMNQSDIYAQRAIRAAEAGDWAQAYAYAHKSDQSDIETELDYLQATALFNAQEYAAARPLFAALTAYKDSQTKELACVYHMAEDALIAGDLIAARDGFWAAAGYEDALTRYDECRYAIAEEYLSQGDDRTAFLLFLELGDCKNAPQRAKAIARALTGEDDDELALLYAQGYTAEDWAEQERFMAMRAALSNHRLAAGKGHIALLGNDGRVYCSGANNDGQCETEDWVQITAVAAGYAHTLALMEDGHVLATGNNSYNQCDVGNWSNVTAICCGPWDSYAIRADGSLLHCGFTSLPNLSGWTNVVALNAGDASLAAVRQGGTLLASLPGIGKEWRDLCAACPIDRNIAALKKDGTLLCDGRDFPGWTDVIAIDSSASLLVGLRSDGTLLVEPLLPVNKALLSALASEEHVIGFSLAGTYALLLHEDGSLTAPGAPDEIQAFLREPNEGLNLFFR